MPTCLVTIPTAWTAARRLPVRSVIYNRSDKHSEFGETDQTFIRDLEEQMLRGADRVIYVSRALMEQEAALTAGRARFLDHGVDLDRFRTGLPESAGPGRTSDDHGWASSAASTTTSIDFDLLERLAKSIPEAELVLVGDATCSMERLTSQPNVHLARIPAVRADPRPRRRVRRRAHAVAAQRVDRGVQPDQAQGVPRARACRSSAPTSPRCATTSTSCAVADDHDTFVELVRLTMRDGGQAKPAVAAGGACPAPRGSAGRRSSSTSVTRPGPRADVRHRGCHPRSTASRSSRPC